MYKQKLVQIYFSTTQLYNRKGWMTMNSLQMMQQFYKEYNQRSRQMTQNNTICKYARKTSSNTDKMTKFLINYGKRQRGMSAVINSQYNKVTAQSQSSKPLNRSGVNYSESSKRTYFKNIYTQSHPLLTSQHKITFHQIDQPKGLKTEPIQSLTKNMINQTTLMLPNQQRNSMQEFKKTMIRIKQHKKEKFEKVRYNYIVNNCFKNHLQPVSQNTGSKIKKLSINTRQRIFPDTEWIKL